LHVVHEGCVSMSRSSLFSISGNCYVCRAPSHPDAAEMSIASTGECENLMASVLGRVPKNMLGMERKNLLYDVIIASCR